jgi:hypothetical protein
MEQVVMNHAKIVFGVRIGDRPDKAHEAGGGVEEQDQPSDIATNQHWDLKNGTGGGDRPDLVSVDFGDSADGSLHCGGEIAAECGSDLFEDGTIGFQLDLRIDPATHPLS